ncbi:MAG TPA: EAL domain-containing protein [Rubrivivax sp.]|nr:EAL domain-containing protein [Rubrivivax sp.]
MSSPLIAASYDFWTAAQSYLLACVASYLALHLAKRVRSPDRAMANGWWAWGSLALGSGIWAMHFVGMQALQAPFELGFDRTLAGLSWAAAVSVAALALYIARTKAPSIGRLGTGALALASGICAMHLIGVAATDTKPGIEWNLPLVGAMFALALAGSAAAVLIFFLLRKRTGQRAWCWQVAAALIIGAALNAVHHAGMAAVGFAEGSISQSAGQLRGNGVGAVVAAGSLLLMALTMLAARLDSRLQRRSSALAASLQSANVKLQQLAFRDALTGLPNRLLFDEHVSGAVERSTRSNQTLAVLFIDLDGFKPVNDSFGHARGDEVLCEMAKRLQQLTRSSDTVARVGGDEFVLLLEEMDGPGAAATAQRIIDTCSAPVTGGNGHELRLSCSIGIALFPTDGPLDQLLAHADAAMYAAKRIGGSSYAFFEPKMNAGIREQIDLQRDLREALGSGGQLQLHYQPKVHSATGRITGVEALVRWRHPQHGLLAPGLFIPVAERFGLIGVLGDWVIDEACRQLRSWIDDGLQLRMAINLSVVQLRQEELLTKVRQALHENRLEGALLTFEITESVAMDDTEGTLRAFGALAALGVRLSIDDFGTGYSSLSYLRKLRAGQLKIDRSFVQDLDSSADARAIVEAVVKLSHSLGLNVVAEGVETEAQRKVLADLGCDELQGFFFARPMPAHVLAEWAADRGRPDLVHFAPSAFIEVDS